MPSFDFTCSKCDKTEEHFVKRDELVHCECGQEMAKELCAPSFHLKGNGWARDGYSKDSREPALPKKTKNQKP